MKVLKIKNFKTYQPVKIGNDHITFFSAEDKNKMVSNQNAAFFVPELASVVIKNKKTGEELIVPTANVAAIVPADELLKSGKPEQVAKKEAKAAAKNKK